MIVDSHPSRREGEKKRSSRRHSSNGRADASIVNTTAWFQPQREISITEILLWSVMIFLLTSPFTFWLMQVDPTVRIMRDLSQMRQADTSQWRLYAARALVLAVAIGFTFPRWTKARYAWVYLWPFAPFVLWSCLTLLWSDAVSTSLHSIIAFVMLILATFLMGLRIPHDSLARATIAAAAVTAVTSILFCVLLPHYGIHQIDDAAQAVHAGAWRGVYDHKNHLGQTLGIFASGVALAGPTLIQSQKLRWTLFGVLIFLIFLSSSASALAVVPIAVAITWILFILGRRNRMRAIMVLVPTAIVGTFAFDYFLSAIGRDSTLTGRTQVWEVAAEWIGERALTGWGYNSLSYGGFAYELMRKRGLFDPHNAYVETILGTGFIGLILYLLPVVAAWVKAQRHRLAVGSEAEVSLMFASMTMAWLVTSFTEVNGRPFSSAGALGFFVLTAWLTMPVGRRLRLPSPGNAH